MVPSWGPSHHGVFLQPRKNVAKLYNMIAYAKNLRILSNTSLLVGRYFYRRPIFLDAMASTTGIYRLGAVASITFLTTASTVAYCRPGGRLFAWQSYRIIATRLVSSNFPKIGCFSAHPIFVVPSQMVRHHGKVEGHTNFLCPSTIKLLPAPLPLSALKQGLI